MIFVTGASKKQGEVLSAAIAKARALIQAHKETLARQRLALVKRDHYGVVDETAWDKEWTYFVGNVIRPRLTDKERTAFDVLQREGPSIVAELANPVRDHAKVLDRDLAWSDDMAPLEFEQWCERKLASVGWQCSTTKASGDQGADVLAEKTGTRVVIQCKLYNSPVGNKAVQEGGTSKNRCGVLIGRVEQSMWKLQERSEEYRADIHRT